MKDSVHKYLLNYAEPEVDLIKSWILSEQILFENAISIPLFDEEITTVTCLLNSLINTADPLLIILVINCPANQVDSPAAVRTESLLDKLQTLYKNSWSSDDNCINVKELGHHRILIIDRCRFGALIPSHQGVGLARKIAGDCASYLFYKNRLARPWLYCTDADVVLPADYFKAIDLVNIDESVSAFIFPFRHLSSSDLIQNQARLVYELYLHDYVRGLAFAGSPFAYQTIGSLLVINLPIYCKVRGFPKRSGAEDFYLLNKLIKLASLISLEAPFLHIESRVSQRVPFGTGPALTRLISHGHPFDVPIFYPSICFKLLKTFLNSIVNVVAVRLAGPPLLEHLLMSNKEFSTRHSQLVLAALTAIKFDQKTYQSLVFHKDSKQRLYHFNCWFDAFKTLKFLKFLVDNAYPLMTLNDWLIANSMDRKELDNQLEILRSKPISIHDIRQAPIR